MKKDPRIFLEHILDSIEHIEEYVGKINEEKFLHDQKTQDAVLRRLEVIGEAVKNIPRTFLKQHTEIQWREVAGMRDILIHEYFGIHLKIVWATIKRDIPKLKKVVGKILEEIEKVSAQPRLK